jgi:hypothetical protein
VVNQLWWIGPVLLVLGYGSRWLAKRRRSAAPRGNVEAISGPAVLHVYDAGTVPLDLTAAHPSFESEQPIPAVEWAPDERRLAALTLRGDDPLVRILDSTPVSGGR